MTLCVSAVRVRVRVPTKNQPVRLLSLCIDTYMLDIVRRVCAGERSGTADRALAAAVPAEFWAAVPVTELPDVPKVLGVPDAVRLFPDGSWDVAP
jgi:hypothetical protein